MVFHSHFEHGDSDKKTFKIDEKNIKANNWR